MSTELDINRRRELEEEERALVNERRLLHVEKKSSVSEARQKEIERRLKQIHDRLSRIRTALDPEKREKNRQQAKARKKEYQKREQMKKTVALLTNGTNEGAAATSGGQDLALPRPSNRMMQSIPMSSSRECEAFQRGVAVGAGAPPNIHISVTGPYVTGGGTYVNGPYVSGPYVNGDVAGDLKTDNGTATTTNSSSTTNNSTASGSNAAIPTQHDISEFSKKMDTISDKLDEQSSKISEVSTKIDHQTKTVKEVGKEVGTKTEQQTKTLLEAMGKESSKISKEVGQKIEQQVESIQKSARENKVDYEKLLREVLRKCQQNKPNSISKNHCDQFDGGNVAATPQRKRSSPPTTVPSQTEKSVATVLRHLFENNTATEIKDMLLEAMKKEGANSYDENELYQGIWCLLGSTLEVATDFEKGESKVPNLAKSDLKQLVKENPNTNLSKLLGDRIHKFGRCYVCMTDSNSDVPPANSNDLQLLLHHQPLQFAFQQFLEVKYASDGQHKDAKFQFNAHSQRDCQLAVDFAVRQLTSDDLIKCTFSGSRDRLCAVSPNVLKAVASKKDCIVHVKSCKLDADQVSALPGAKSCLVFEDCPIDSLLGHLFCATSKPEPALKVAFLEQCPPLSALSKFVSNYCVEALMLKGIDLCRVYEKHHPTKAKELVAADMKLLIDSSSRVGCDICVSGLKFKDDSAVKDGAFNEICSSVWVQENVPIARIIDLGSKLKEPGCTWVTPRTSLSSTSGVVDLLSEEGEHLVELIQSEQCVRFTGYGKRPPFKIRVGEQVTHKNGCRIELGADGLLSYTFPNGYSKRRKVPFLATEQMFFCKKCAQGERGCSLH